MVYLLKNLMTYRAREPLLAVRNDLPKPNGFVTISPGSIMTIRSEVKGSGFVDVLHDGHVVSVFMRDMQARAEVVEQESA